MPVYILGLDRLKLDLKPNPKPNDWIEEILIHDGSEIVHFYELSEEKREQLLIRIIPTFVNEYREGSEALWVDFSLLYNRRKEPHLYLFKNALAALLANGATPFDGAKQLVISGTAGQWLQKRKHGEPLMLK